MSPPTTEPGAGPAFEPKLIREALATFPACSAAGLFGYRPSLLRQCADAESYFFMLTLGSFVNKLAAGEAPRLLQPFLAGGVSIALQKPNRTIRPLCCGDPIRRLVAKCFCMGGKNSIEAPFKGLNFGVCCPGGVEIIAHSLSDTLLKHRNS